MEVVPFVGCGAVGAISVVGPDTIQGSITRTAAAGGQTTDVVIDELFTIGVAVVNRIEEEVANGVAFEGVVVGRAGVERSTLLVNNTEGWARCAAVCGSHRTVSDGVVRTILATRCGS